MKNLEYYLNLPYSLSVKKDTDFDGSNYFIAYFTELDGLIGTGDTFEKAIDDLLDIRKEWFELNIKLGRTIPEPLEVNQDVPVKVTYRIPNTLNKQIEIYMQNENVSKNTAMTMLIQSGLFNNQFKRVEENMYKNLMQVISSLFYTKRPTIINSIKDRELLIQNLNEK